MATKEGWEKADFPIVCETCLGENPFVRMMKAEYDKECKICQRPFTVFRWKPGNNARFKKTEICQTCAKLKNVCQTCLLDLEFGLPVQVRDAALANAGVSTALSLQSGTSETNRNWYLQQAEKEMENGTFKYDRADLRNQLAKVARTEPYYKRNAPHICTFFLKGQCNRGASCPYRHEQPDNKKGEGNNNNNDGEEQHEHAAPEVSSNQNIRDRYYGKDDPVAKKLLAKMNSHEVTPPADRNIKTVYVGGLTEQITESDLKDHFYGYGEISEIRISKAEGAVDPNMRYNHAFITFATRQSAEAAVAALHNNLIIKYKSLKVGWAKGQARDVSGGAQSAYQRQRQQQIAESSSDDFFGLGGGSTATPFVNAYVPPNPSIHKPSYPSMGPQKFGAKKDR